MCRVCARHTLLIMSPGLPDALLGSWVGSNKIVYDLLKVEAVKVFLVRMEDKLRTSFQS